MLELYPYDAGKGDCLLIRFPGESGTYHNILVRTFLGQITELYL